MSVEEIFKLAYFRTNSSENAYPKGYALEQFNRIYKKVWRAILNANEDFFWTYWTTDIQAGATEYSILRHKEILNEGEETETVIPGIEKVKRVSVLKGLTYEELPQLADNEEGYGWRLKDNHIILSFTPSEDIANGLKIEGIQMVDELTEESTDLFPGHEELNDLDYVLSVGLEAELWRGKQDFDKANYAFNEFQNDLAEIIKNKTSRVKAIYFSDVR